MKAKFFKTPRGRSVYDIVSINIDKYSLSHLQRGEPLKIAFFTDDKTHLPQYKRDIMVVQLGLNINLEEQENVWKERDCEEGIIDKSYLMASIEDIRQNIMGLVINELKVIGVAGLPMEESKKVIDIDVTPPKYIDSKEAMKRLSLSKSTFLGLVKKGKIKGIERYTPDGGWGFLEDDIEKLRKRKPEFLKKIWRRPYSVKSKDLKKVCEKGYSQNNLLKGVDICVSLEGASRLFSVEKDILLKLVKEKKVNKISSDDSEEMLFDKAYLEKVFNRNPEFLIRDVLVN